MVDLFKKQGYKMKLYINKAKSKIDIVWSQEMSAKFIEYPYLKVKIGEKKSNIPLFRSIEKIVQEKIIIQLKKSLPGYMIPFYFESIKKILYEFLGRFLYFNMFIG